jgi:type IV pilus assembly protein PilX
LRMVSFPSREEGTALIAGLLLVLILTILGLAAMMTTTAGLRVAGNDRSSKRVFYIAEAGLEDASIIYCSRAGN